MSGILQVALLSGITLMATLAVGAQQARANDLIVRYDQSQILRLPRAVSELIIGNPSIADVNIQGSDLLVITGKTFGVTNVIALDADRNVIQDQRVVVQRDEQRMVNLHKGAARQSFTLHAGLPADHHHRRRPQLLRSDLQALAAEDQVLRKRRFGRWRRRWRRRAITRRRTTKAQRRPISIRCRSGLLERIANGAAHRLAPFRPLSIYAGTSLGRRPELDVYIERERNTRSSGGEGRPANGRDISRKAEHAGVGDFLTIIAATFIQK